MINEIAAPATPVRWLAWRAGFATSAMTGRGRLENLCWSILQQSLIPDQAWYDKKEVEDKIPLPPILKRANKNDNKFDIIVYLYYNHSINTLYDKYFKIKIKS
jgi:hypothetical protein